MNFRDKVRRMRYFPSAIELLKYCRLDPTSKDNPNKGSEILHRFGGVTSDGCFFFVQVKESKKSGQKWLTSVFPVNEE